MIILVSACLLGQNCKYNGGNNLRRELAEEMAGHTVIPVCPEMLGGLPVPRTPAEIVDGEVVNRGSNSFSALGSWYRKAEADRKTVNERRTAKWKRT